MTRDPIVLEDTQSLFEAAQFMESKQIGDVLVARNGQVCGIVTDRDIVVKAIARGKDPRTTKLGDICDDQIYSVSAEDDLDDVKQLMRDKAIRRIPVLENGSAIGIISLGDLARFLDPDSVLGEVSSSSPR